MGKPMKEGSLMSFFKQGLKPTTNQATVMSTLVLQIAGAVKKCADKQIQHFEDIAPSPSCRAAEGSGCTTVMAGFLERLEQVISCILHVIPEATDGDLLTSIRPVLQHQICMEMNSGRRC